MIDRLNNLFLAYHWTLENIGMVLFGLLLVELWRIQGRSANPTTPRTRFRFVFWITQTNNWLSPILTVICSFVALGLMDGLKPPPVPDLLYAFGAGVMGQALLKIGLKGLRGTLGLNGPTQ